MTLGKGLILAGLFLVVVGGLTVLAAKFGFRLFQLPGDIVWRGKNSVIYIPIATSILLSVVVTFILAMLRR
jgi:hypothetical protein